MGKNNGKTPAMVEVNGKLVPADIANKIAEHAKLKAKVAELEGDLADYQSHLLVTSKVEKPVALVRAIYVAMHDQPRRDVIRKCVAAGIAPNTAKTQYQVLRTKQYKLQDETLLAEIAAAAQVVDRQLAEQARADAKRERAATATA